MAFIGLSPPAIVFVNNDLTDSVQEMLVRQLYISEVVDGATFDERVAFDDTYPNQVRRFNQRLMVVRSFVEATNREHADLVLFIKAGLASVEENKFGPPGATFPVVNIHWGQFGLF